MLHRLLAAGAGLAFMFGAPAQAIGASDLPPAAAVAAFTQQRGGAPLWLRDGVDGRPVRALIAALSQSELDGFAAGPKLADAVKAAADRSRSGTRAEQLEAERLMSAAWVMYVQALHWPASGMIFADPGLAPKIPTPQAILSKLAAASSLAGHVERTSAVNPIYADLRVALAQARDQESARVLRANLERARSLPAEGRFLLVDLAAQRLWMMNRGRPEDSMKVVVGKAEMPTPLIAGTITAATLNPYWNVPDDLVRRNIATGALAGGDAWLKAKGYELLSGWGPDARPIPSKSVNWQEVAAGRLEVRVRQRPGRGNMMGAIKFEFPNRQGIYLHDTPDKALFANATRTFSSGCIRLEDAARLGRWLLGRDPVANGNAPEQQVALPAPVPVFVTYFTARVEQGELSFAPDIYGLDRDTGRLAAR